MTSSTNEINFNATRKSSVLIGRCAERAAKDLSLDRLTVNMDLTVANNDVPLDFTQLLNFSSFDFAHDILGIYDRLDRTTGKLRGCFVPRCAKPEKQAAQ